jgi:hypothetical protein
MKLWGGACLPCLIEMHTSTMKDLVSVVPSGFTDILRSCAGAINGPSAMNDGCQILALSMPKIGGAILVFTTLLGAVVLLAILRKNPE